MRRRLTLPRCHCTPRRFENGTRSERALVGSVGFDLAWAVAADQVRDELRAVPTHTPMWDGRVSVLQVTDAVHGMVRLRALVSAADAPTLWDLRCHVRERLIVWLRENHPEALPRVRAEVGAEVRPTGDGRATVTGPDIDARVFGGTAAGRRRGRDFTGPPPEPSPAPDPPPG